MKIKQVHFDHLKKAIDAELAKRPHLVADYEKGHFPRADNVKDLQVRFNNDLLHIAGLGKYICDNLYSYLNDTHIETALNKICPSVTRRY